MEDDDEFGDLYTDVLQPFASSSSSSSAPPPTLPSAAPQSLHRPIDLNLKNDDEDAIYGARSSNHVVPGKPSNQTLAPPGPAPFAAAADSVPHSLIPAGDVAPGLDDVKLRERGFEDSNFVIGSGGDGGQGENLMEKEVNFDIDEGNLGDEDVGSEPVIPGLSSGPVRQAAGDIENLEASGRDGGDVGDDGAGDDWDSDSEDDLQIVLNDNNHGPLAMERGEMEDDEDEGLVIVADGDPNQATEEQDWGEDAGQAADGERKEMGEAGKAGSGGPVPMKIGYSSHGYHPFHSQFKYVRPGAAPMVGATTSGPGGVPGQVRPPLNMGLMAGRGRGDWRPMGMKNATMQKSFHPGFGPGWGNNTAGRGFGGGLEFTLPSHKTIFDVDIDGFEEKPWKYPGVDTSDFFNFGFNEESWKDYCKQLEQLRLESTMQSKIRVYESGRAEQEYDPDLPPELAAAAGIHDVPSETANPGKSDVGQGDISKGSARLRPPIPTGRAIQVESCFGERLPSIDTRPPRIRDSDAVIEIVLQDSMDDDASAENGVPDRPDNDPPQGDFGGREAEEDAAQVDSEYFDNYPQAFNGRKREPVGTRMPFPNSVHDGIPGRNLPFPPDQPVRNAGSGAQIPVYPGGDFSAEYEERQRQGKAHDRSPQMTPTRRDKNYSDNEPEDSGESMDSRRSPLLSSPVLRDVHESSVEHRDANEEEAALADGSPGMGKDETTSNTTGMDALEDGASKKQKPGSQGEQSVIHEPDDGEDSKAARSSDNSRARSGSSREYRRDVVDEEVIQGRSTRMGSVKRHFDEKEHGVQRRNRDGRQEVERNRIVVKGREDSYPYREFDPSSSHHLHARPDGFDRRKERENLDGPWPRRDDDSSSRRIRTEETRKRERSAEIGSRHRSKVREIDRSDKDELIHSRKQTDNGGYRVYYDKDLGPRHRERDDNLKGRYEHMDDYHVKRKRDDELLKRDHMDKEEILHGHRENTGRRKRERDEVLDLRKRDEQQRLRDNHDDYHSVRNKDDSWSQRERVEKPREREEWQRLKQPHEENISKREREEGRAVTRGGRSAEDKGWVGHTKAKDENKGSDKDYQHKETVRHSEPSKRRDRTEDGSSHHGGREDVYTRSNQMSNGERRSRQERPNIRNDRAVSASDEHKVHDRKHKENTRRNKESDSGDNSTFSSKRNQEDHGGHSHETGSKGTTEQGVKEHGIPAQHHHSRKQKEDGGSSDDEQQASRRGRSKLERWTSHKERDFNIKSKSSSTLKHKEINRNDSGSLEGSKKLPNEPSKPVETLDIQHLAEEKDAADPEAKEGETTRHLDTVEKLKKRSERFKLPMPIEKDASTVKKMESEALASTKGGSPVDSEIKPERPARKRRWISN